MTRLPATVARLRSCGEPTSQHACASGSARGHQPGERRRRCGSSQPQSSDHVRPSDCRRSHPREMSIRVAMPRRTPRSISSNRSVPPAMTRAGARAGSPRRATASSMVATATYRCGRGSAPGPDEGGRSCGCHLHHRSSRTYARPSAAGTPNPTAEVTTPPYHQHRDREQVRKHRQELGRYVDPSLPCR